ncbi:MAG: C_GCAxxG_C_C family protein [Lachnospiraceae bacterium]|jgi:C_GCAxxG_C_C family probable redox protein|nr:C_GCAxxG_C_C family protein [Lachnospiraceae bacterium]
MKTDIDMEQLQTEAVEVFTSGFTCSEAVIHAIRKALELDIPDCAIAMSSGIPWGFGGAGCICGAVAGGAMCIGFVYGRTTPGDPRNLRCFELTNELHDRFKEEFGAVCCRILTRGYEKMSPERKAHCIKMVKFAVVTVAEILIREHKKDLEA